MLSISLGCAAYALIGMVYSESITTSELGMVYKHLDMDVAHSRYWCLREILDANTVVMVDFEATLWNKKTNTRLNDKDFVLIISAKVSLYYL